MGLAEWVAAVGLLALIAYAVLAGADFGGGVWDMLAGGPRWEEQRAAIARAMGPVWEANHVWLIFLIVLLFSCFPGGFSPLNVALFLPFHLVLLGIILRGSAFVFRSYGASVIGHGPLLGQIFGAASIITPVLLGMCLGAVSSGRISVSEAGRVTGHAAAWVAPVSLAIGALTLAVCAYLAAVYLTLETEGALREDFRRRALGSGATMAALAALTLLIARWDAPRLWEGLTRPESAPLLGGGVVTALVSGWAVLTGRFALARGAAVAQVALLLVGWGLTQWPYLIYPDVTFTEAAAPPATLRFVLWSMVPGALLLIPSLWLLFAVFKGANPAAPAEPGAAEEH